jgi:hypothetical protein
MAVFSETRAKDAKLAKVFQALVLLRVPGVPGANL